MTENNNIEKKRNLILTGNLWKALLLISLPVAISSLVVQVFNLFDIYFSSRIGEAAMGASVFVGPITNIFYAVSEGFGVAATILVAREIAKKDFKQGRKHLSQMILVSLILSAGLLVVCLSCSEWILSLCGATGDLLQESKTYFSLVILTIPLKFMNDIYFGQQRAIGSNRQIMVLNIASIVVKFLFSYLFIFKMNFGIEGLGYSSLIATGFISIFALVSFFVKRSDLKIGIKDFKISWGIIGAILLVSMPIIIEKSTQSFGNVIVNGYATSLGGNVLSAYGITNRINSIIFSFSSGFGVALVGIVSQNQTVGNMQRIREAKNKGLILSLAIVGCLLVVMLFMANPIAGIFAANKEEGVNSEELKKLIIQAMSIYTISAIPWTIMHIYFGIFQGFKQTKYTLIISLSRLWIFRVFLVGILLKFTQMGAYAIWYGMLISNIAAMLIAVLIYLLRFKKRIKIEKGY